jgi:hypothetical protein
MVPSIRQGELFASASGVSDTLTPTSYVPDADAVRKPILRLLAEARAADALPWPPARARVHAIVVEQSANWLPEPERSELRAAFRAELARLGFKPD